MKQLESIGAFITTLDTRRTGAGILILLLVICSMGYACFVLYKDSVQTRNETMKYKDALLTRANELLRESSDKRVEAETMYKSCLEQNNKLENILKSKVK